ncbi:Methionyl-tRNA formyltransferase [Roseibium album]|nr:Methionyl-tRNA formyltransferase [Roseibium album]
MADVTKDDWLNQYLKSLRLADHVYSDETVRWGELIEPNSDPRPRPTAETLRIAVIASLPVGFLTLKTLLAYARCFPARLHIVCLLTDDPENPDAKISAKKRIWHLYPDNERKLIEQETVKTALEAGIPAYTGDIKRDWFRNALSELQPDAVLCCGFGQLVDRPFLQIPNLGVYNFHPSDLAHGFGAGPSPYEDCVSRNAQTACWTVHLMNEEIDDGHIVGSSPPINIRQADGTFPPDPKDYYNKVTDGLDHLVFHTVNSLVDWHQSGQTAPISKIEYESLFTDAIKTRMLEPIRDFPKYLFPEPSLFSAAEES